MVTADEGLVYAENGDQASISELRDFTADSLDQLTALESQVPDAAEDELVRAAQLLVEIDAAAQRACPLCAGSGINSGRSIRRSR